MYRTHEMRMVRIEESGLEEWACPTCGRRLLLRWPPDYEKQVIETGDDTASHVGSAADDALRPLPYAPTATSAYATGRRWLRETGAHAAPAHVISP